MNVLKTYVVKVQDAEYLVQTTDAAEAAKKAIRAYLEDGKKTGITTGGPGFKLSLAVSIAEGGPVRRLR